MKRLHALVDRLRRESAPDARSDIFEVTVEPRGTAVALVGVTTLPAVADELLQRAVALRRVGHVRDEIVRLPDPELGAERFGLIRSAVAPLYAQPALPAPQISQLVTGMQVAVLARRDPWLRVRAEDGYLGWLHSGYLLTGGESWVAGWRAGSEGEPVVSLGAELAGTAGELVARLPWGARGVRDGVEIVLPDGRRGQPVAGLVVDAALLPFRFPATAEAILATARRWRGVPYLWGGITFGGADCSGFIQAVFRMHGVGLPRDSDLQALAGVPLDPGAALERVRAGDLLFFAERFTRVSHVALSLGGSRILHSALGNGGVAADDLLGDLPLERRLRATLTGVRRILPD